jgi:hypothetical protein
MPSSVLNSQHTGGESPAQEGGTQWLRLLRPSGCTAMRCYSTAQNTARQHKDELAQGYDSMVLLMYQVGRTAVTYDGAVRA